MSYFKKEFGQNFLTSRKYAKRLVKACNVDINDIVLEVGAGAGMVTQYLVCKAKQVIAIEIDERFTALLENRFKEDVEECNLKIINKDILRLDVNNYDLKIKEYKVIGSLPYNISKRIIKNFLEEDNYPASITVIIQKEVAEDYVAVPPRAKFLSNYVKIFGDAELVEVVPKEVFNPMPKVDGAILKIKVRGSRIEDSKKFIKFLKSAFLNPRKKLVNNLSAIYSTDKKRLLNIFSSLKVDANARASNLELKQWQGIYKNICI